MKVLIMTLGTRGDVQPFVALGRGLLAAGHEVVLAAPHRFAGFVAGHGVPFAGVDEGPMRLMDDPASAALVEGGIGARLRQLRSMPSMFDQVLEDCWAVASQGAGAGADVVVHNGQIIAGQHVAEALGVPAVLALPSPVFVPTRQFSWPGVDLPGWLPAMAHRATFLGMKATAAMFGRVVDQWREHTLGLPRRRGRHDPLLRPDNGPASVLHAFSPAVLPPPPDWPDSALTTGYWNLPPGDALPRRVEDFLNAGDPPVFVGFGSMSGRDPQGTTAAVLEAVRRAGARLVIGTGWGGLADSPPPDDDVLVVDEVDYQRLFPRVAAVVHHGGAGTSGTAFAAGRPQVVCPFVADQPFWARLAEQRGVAPAPVPQRHLNASRLATAITTAMGDPDMARTAQQLGRRVRAEDGVSVAVTALEHIALAHRQK